MSTTLLLEDLLASSSVEGRARVALRLLEQRLHDAHMDEGREPPSLRIMTAPLLELGPLPFPDADHLRRLLTRTPGVAEHELWGDRSPEITEAGVVTAHSALDGGLLWSLVVEGSGAAAIAISLFTNPDSCIVVPDDLEAVRAFFATIARLAQETAAPPPSWLVRVTLDEATGGKKLTMATGARGQTLETSALSRKVFEDLWAVGEPADAVAERLCRRVAGIFGLPRPPVYGNR